jgi:hypothetical protein
MTYDGFHSYTYDAEGNITAIDGGATAQYVYNALNQRVRTVVGSSVTEIVFNANGQRISTWNPIQGWEIAGQTYWGSKPVEFYADGSAHFQHQDWLGTDTDQNWRLVRKRCGVCTLPISTAARTGPRNGTEVCSLVSGYLPHSTIMSRLAWRRSCCTASNS